MFSVYFYILIRGIKVYKATKVYTVLTDKYTERHT